MAEGAEGFPLKVKAGSRKQMTNGTNLLTLKVTFKTTLLKAPPAPTPALNTTSN